MPRPPVVARRLRGRRLVAAHLPRLFLAVATVGQLLADGLPLSSFELPDFIGSGQCAFCHSGLTDSAGHDVSLDTHWRATLMANSAKDPLWQAKVASEIQRNPGLKGVIENKCATCHMPMARTQAVTLGSPVGVLEDGFLHPANGYHAAAMDGVSCTLCHQLRRDHLGEERSFSGQYLIDVTTEPPHRLAYGPFPDPHLPPMQNRVGFTPAWGTHLTDAALCAVCHNLRTPYVDAAGEVRGEFPEQMIYSEWKHSAYSAAPPAGRSCQDCHLPAAVGGVKLSNRGGPGLNLPRRSPFGRHHFVGGNTLLLDLFTRQLGPQALTASTANLAATRDRVTTQLREQTARLTVPEIRVAPEALTLLLHVTNLAGHKLPSGFPSRRTWLHVRVEDAQGTVCFESGRPQPDGTIEGNDADRDPAMCEPHWQQIDQSEQVQIYEAIMQDSQGDITSTLLRAASYRKDNRLLPDGFDKSTADADIAPTTGPAADPDFQGGTDRVVYHVSTRGATGPFTIQAELLYQTLAGSFARDLFRDTNSVVRAFQTMLEGLDLTPVALAQIQRVVDPTLATRLLLPQIAPDGQLRLSVQGPPASTIRIQSSPDLLHWVDRATLTLTNPPTSFRDAPVTEGPMRYYRLRGP